MFSAATGPAWADAKFPKRPITLLVGYSPGGQTDDIARMVASRLSNVLGQLVIVQNKEGAASTIADRAVSESKPEGYTMMVGGTSAHAIARVLSKSPYDAGKDFRAIGEVSTLPLSIALNNDVSAKTLQELITLIKQNPDAYSYATGGAGGIEHLVGKIFKQSADVPKLLHVPLKGGAPGATAVIGKQMPTPVNSVFWPLPARIA